MHLIKKRKVIVHYHIFKNGGTSIDNMLNASFGSKWMNWDGPDAEDPNGGKISSKELERFILEHQDLVAISSHRIAPPLPNNPRLEIYPIIILREPIKRAYSAYLFESGVQANSDVPVVTFEEYLLDKFKNEGRNVVENFQACCLANLDYFHFNVDYINGHKKILEDAKSFLMSIKYFGVLENFSESLKRFKYSFGNDFPDLIFHEFHSNSTLERMKKAHVIKNSQDILNLLSKDVADIFILRNQLDIKLYQFALGCAGYQ